MKNLLPLFAGLALFAAGCDKADTDETDTTETGETDTTDIAMSIDAAWSATGFTITINNMPGAGFDLGLAETGTADDSTAWFGEDCFNGTAGYNLCHAFTGNMGSLTALSGADRTADNVVAGSTTLLNQSLAEGTDGAALLTYMATFDDASCVVWGEDASYYASFGCSAM